MKKTVSVLLASMLATMPLTSMAMDFEDTARVVSVNEKLERVNTPREECTTETIQSSTAPQSSERELGGAVIGGLAGAILGSQVGKGNGKTAGAAVGAVTGALVGDRIQNSGSGSTTGGGTQTVQRCRVIDSWQTRSLGYDVTYEYRGRTYTETLPFSPGKTLKVNVKVNAAR